MAATPKPVRKEIKNKMKSYKNNMKENVRKGISSPGVMKVAKKMKKDTSKRMKHEVGMKSKGMY